MDERKRGSKPRGHNVYALEENRAGESEDNCRTKREPMNKYSDGRVTPQPELEIADLVMLKCKKH